MGPFMFGPQIIFEVSEAWFLFGIGDPTDILRRNAFKRNLEFQFGKI
jgi:hypothetical protein